MAMLPLFIVVLYIALKRIILLSGFVTIVKRTWIFLLDITFIYYFVIDNDTYSYYTV